MKFTKTGSLVLTLGAASLVFASGGAESLLKKAEFSAKRLQSFHCKLLTSRTYGGRSKGMQINETLDVTFQRPNKFVVESKESNYPTVAREISDGKNVYYVNEKNYSKGPIDHEAKDFHWYHNDLLLTLVTGSFDEAMEFPFKPTVKQLPDDQWNGESYHVVDVAVAGGYPIDYKIYLDDSNMIHRIIHTEEENGKVYFGEDVQLQQFEKNPAVDATAFSFTPNANQKPFDTAAMRAGETPLITVGRQAAPFSLPTPEGPRLALEQALAGKKALLLNFWFVHCPPCRAEHPKLEKLYEDLKDKGLGVLSVDDQDTAAAVAKYWKGAGLTFKTVLSGPMAAVDPKTGYPNYRGPKLPDYASLVPYGVHECPTNILLNAQGEVVYVSSGWDEGALRAALADLGVR